MTTVCSAGQMTDESNVLETRTSTTAIPMSAERWTYTGALPEPTDRQGLPAWLAAATALGPPVVQMKSMSGWWNRYCDTSSVGSGMTWIVWGGSPAASPAAWSSSAARTVHFA